jgi:DNA-binding SARP family transcriptional activator
VLRDLRKALADAAPDVLRLQGQTVAVASDAVDLDVAAFERLAADGSAPALERAAELYRGDLLVGFAVNEIAFEDWLVAERERLREQALAALGRLLAGQAKGSSTEPAIRTALRLIALDPLQEEAHRTLMRLYARQGRRGAALKQYHLCVSTLERELGAEPEVETRRLYRDLLQRPRATEAATAVTSHDSVRSPRLDVPVPDLPTTETPLFGRETEIATLRSLLGDATAGGGHVATVVGEAGIGKTRLVGALAAAAIAQSCRVLVGHCYESDSILPFGPWVEACRSGKISVDDNLLATLHPMRRATLTRLLPEATPPACRRQWRARCPCSRAWRSSSSRPQRASHSYSCSRICTGPTR